MAKPFRVYGEWEIYWEAADRWYAVHTDGTAVYGKSYDEVISQLSSK